MKSMDAALKSMNLEKVLFIHLCIVLTMSSRWLASWINLSASLST